MNYLRIIYCLSFILALFGGCIEPFSPEIDDYDDLLVVDALITDDESSQTVRISRSHPIDTSMLITESGATVFIADADGNSYEFQETGQGIYVPHGGSFFPEVGNTYTLVITTQNGSTYNSEPVVMKATPKIDSLYFKRKSVPSDDVGDLDDGFQIYLNTRPESNNTGYFKFEWEEAYEIITPYASFLDYDSQTNQIVLRENNISNCWIEAPSTNLNLFSTENLSINEVEAHPIRFIPFREPLLREKYSILVKQYALSEEGYLFWQNLKKSNESTGSLYDSQPFRLTGNIKNINDPAESVLGYFDITTVVTKRLYITGKDDLPDDITVESIFDRCRVDADTIVDYNSVPKFIGTGYLISRYIFGSGYEMVIKSCIDCRLKGSNVKPEFWE